jgi:hypothetical protein
MKAILKFDLDNENDRTLHEQCIKASDMAQFIWELRHNFWRRWKHDESDLTLENYKEAIYNLLEEHKLNIE